MSRHLDFLAAVILLFWAAVFTGGTFLGGFTVNPGWLWASVPAGAFACWWAVIGMGLRHITPSRAERGDG